MLLSLPAKHIILFSMMTALQTTLATSRPSSSTAPRCKYIQAPYSTKAIVNTEIVDLVRINYWAQKQCWEVGYFNFNQLNNNLFINNSNELFINIIIIIKKKISGGHAIGEFKLLKGEGKGDLVKE